MQSEHGNADYSRTMTNVRAERVTAELRECRRFQLLLVAWFAPPGSLASEAKHAPLRIRSAGGVASLGMRVEL